MGEVRVSKIVRMCFNWKVLTALGVLGLGVWIAAPSLLGAVLPLLLVAVCPLSMLLMMWGMQGEGSEHEQSGSLIALERKGEHRLPLKSQLSSIQAQQQAISEEVEGTSGNGSEGGPPKGPARHLAVDQEG